MRLDLSGTGRTCRGEWPIPRDTLRTRPGRRWSGLEPGERAGHAAPQLAGAGGVLDRLALLAEHRVGGTLSRQPLAAGQVGRDVRVALARLGEQRARLGARTSTSKRGERPGVDEPGGVAIAGVGGEQLIELSVGLECQQPVRLR